MKNLPENSVDREIFFAAVNENEPDALTCLNCCTKKIAAQIFNLKNISDPERFAIGGGISSQTKFISAIQKNLDEIYSRCPVNLPKAEVVACKYGNDANLIGALQNFKSRKSLRQE